MKVIRAKTAGFCFGVKRAVDLVYQQLEIHKGKSIYTFGSIIHNEEVVKDLKKRGVVMLQTEEELAKITDGVVVIRSHGVKREAYKQLEKANDVIMVDATCPDVRKIHRIVDCESENGATIVVIGDAVHPEVQGILGWVKGQVVVIMTSEEARNVKLPENKSVVIVAQTTFNYNKFKELVEILLEKRYDIIVLNTICHATRKRQEEALRIAKQVEAMIVIGDKHSSNTQKLFQICQQACKATYYIQTLADLDLNQLGSVETVGITAGASTPNNIIEEVQNNVRVIF